METKLTQDEIRKSGLLEAEKALEEKLAEDVELEKAFKKDLGTYPEGMDDEVKAMIKVYNEMIDSYVRTRFDVEIWRLLEEGDKDRHEKRVNAEKLLYEKGVTIQVIRRQLALKLKSK
jgi:hypothetical protein